MRLGKYEAARWVVWGQILATQKHKDEGLAVLTRDQILQADDRITEEVAVPEWGGKVLVRSLSGTERDAFEDAIIEGKGKNRQVNMRNLRAKLVAMAVVGADGLPIFTRADVEALGSKNAAPLDRIFERAQILSGLRDEDVDELVGNSNGDPSDGSTSA